ncbi:hypothetical protein F4818DRAFT_443770 [Hypoxylon cercidicola]|nr:hypothetical protein F4818DRAFT_443770 [Hypoxylon cercidicola]
MARRKQSPPAKKQVKPKEPRVHERAWDHLTARIPGISHSAKPASSKTTQTRASKPSTADNDHPGNRRLFVRQDDPAVAEWYRLWDQEYGKPAKPTAQDPKPSQSSHGSSWDAGNRRMFVSMDDPAVAKWDRLWEEEYGNSAKETNERNDSSDDAEFLYERKKRKLSRVDSSESQWINQRTAEKHKPAPEAAQKRPSRRDKSFEDSDDDLSTNIRRWDPFSGHKRQKSKGNW